MAKSVKKRVREWRERKAREGGRSLSTWLEPDTARMLDFLLGHYGETVSPVIARAIESLYNVTCDGGALPQAGSGGEHAPVPMEAAEKPARMVTKKVARHGAHVDEAGIAAAESSASESMECLSPVLMDLQQKLADGIPLRDLKSSHLLTWIKDREASGASFRAMARELNEARIPTLTGRGEWEEGMIPTLLILSH